MNLTSVHIDALLTRRLRVKDVALELNVQPNALSVYLAREGFKIPPSAKFAARRAAHTAREARTQALAEAFRQVANKTRTREEAAKTLNCHPRTILRHGPR